MSIASETVGYFKTTLKGVSWMTGFRVGYRIIGVIRIAIIAHLLSPYDLGLFGIVTIVLAFLEVLTETGINIFLIQEKDKLDSFIDTAWVTSIARGTLISLFILAATNYISVFFNSPNSRTLLYLSALIPFIRGFINPAIIKFQKELEFNKEFFYRISVYFVESIVSVLIVLITKSPFGLVWGLVVGALYEVSYTFFVVKPLPKFVYDLEKIKNIFNRGRWVTLFGIFDYLYTQSDNIIVGRMLGLSSLGVYDNAYTISTAPLTEIGDVFYRVTFPIFSKISGDAARLKSAFFKNTIVNFVLMSLAGIFIYVFASPIVNILFGNGWEAAIPVVKLLTILGVVRGVAGSTSSFLMAKGKQKYTAIITIVSTLGLLATIIPLIRAYGLIGAGLAAIFGTAISLPFTIYFINKTLKN